MQRKLHLYNNQWNALLAYSRGLLLLVFLATSLTGNWFLVFPAAFLRPAGWALGVRYPKWKISELRGITVHPNMIPHFNGRRSLDSGNDGRRGICVVFQSLVWSVCQNMAFCSQWSQPLPLFLSLWLASLKNKSRECQCCAKFSKRLWGWPSCHDTAYCGSNHRLKVRRFVAPQGLEKIARCVT